jgi:hypothetical protein
VRQDLGLRPHTAPVDCIARHGTRGASEGRTPVRAELQQDVALRCRVLASPPGAASRIGLDGLLQARREGDRCQKRRLWRHSTPQPA